MESRINRQDITSRVLDAYTKEFTQISEEVIMSIGITQRCFLDDDAFFAELSKRFLLHFTMDNIENENLEWMIKAIDFDEIGEVFGWFQIHRVYGVLSFTKRRKNLPEASC